MKSGKEETGKDMGGQVDLLCLWPTWGFPGTEPPRVIKLSKDIAMSSPFFSLFCFYAWGD